ncbi:hypothetical protein EV44_g3765 [Erysiphe necator]|uniref:CCHC-type domain-containing protein n=1 Tax=Uncinula necator TaxID=52586 RepID=A0A0B1PHR6_UNCNE|nr:hypothetical protein EV44_g3765 [Erysiphe necator]
MPWYQKGRPLPSKRDLPPGYNPSLSRHPVVNGTVPFSLHCFKCGELGHSSRECVTPLALSHEERTVLYNRYVDRVLEANQRQVNSANVYKLDYNYKGPQNKLNSQDPLIQEPTRSPLSSAEEIDFRSIEENYLNYPTQTYEEATGQIETSSFRPGGNAVDSITLDMEKHNTSKTVPRLSVKEVDKKETIRVQSFPVEIIYDSQKSNTDRGPVSDELDLLNLSEGLEDFNVVVDEEKRSIIEILKEAHAEVAEIQSSRKRRHVDFDDTISPEFSEDRHEFNPKDPRVTPKIKRGALKPMIRRRGEGPLNYKSMLASTMIIMSVLEFCQASPDAARQFRHLVTRENEKRGRKKGCILQPEVEKLDYPIKIRKNIPPKLQGILREARPFRLNTACVISNQRA